MSTHGLVHGSSFSLSLEWVHHGGARPDGAHAARLAEAAYRDPEVALVDRWRHDAVQAGGQIPAWATEVDAMIPRSGVQPCQFRWVEHLYQLVALIGNERCPSEAGRRLVECGAISDARRDWARECVAELDAYLQGRPVPTPIGGQATLYLALGEHDPEKLGAVRLLREALTLACELPPAEFAPAYAALPATSGLAREMRRAISYVQFRCGYRWQQIVLETCRAIGDADYRDASGRFWNFDRCDSQLAHARTDDPARLDASSAVLVGLWSWLTETPGVRVLQRYPSVAAPARRVRYTLGEETPAKRWLAGRAFVALRMWLENLDNNEHGPLLSPWPRLTPVV